MEHNIDVSEMNLEKLDPKIQDSFKYLAVNDTLGGCFARPYDDSETNPQLELGEMLTTAGKIQLVTSLMLPTSWYYFSVYVEKDTRNGTAVKWFYIPPVDPPHITTL